MAGIDIAVMLIVMAAFFAYLNERFIHLETTIGIMLIAAVVSFTGFIHNQFGLISRHSTFISVLGVCCLA